MAAAGVEGGVALLLACAVELEGEGVAARVEGEGSPPEWKGRRLASGLHRRGGRGGGRRHSEKGRGSARVEVEGRRRSGRGGVAGDEMRANADEYRG